MSGEIKDVSRNRNSGKGQSPCLPGAGFQVTDAADVDCRMCLCSVVLTKTWFQSKISLSSADTFGWMLSGTSCGSILIQGLFTLKWQESGSSKNIVLASRPYAVLPTIDKWKGYQVGSRGEVSQENSFEGEIFKSPSMRENSEETLISDVSSNMPCGKTSLIFTGMETSGEIPGST